MRKALVFSIAVSIVWGILSASPAGAGCPASTKITKMNATLQGFKEGGPYDVGKIRSVKAFVLDGGKKMKICISNMDLTSYLNVDALGAKPPKHKGDFALILQLSNGSNLVVAGKYSPRAGYGKPFWATAEVLTSAGKAGTFVSIGASDGVAEIVEIGGGRVCGKFNLTGTSGSASGEFNAEIVK